MISESQKPICHRQLAKRVKRHQPLSEAGGVISMILEYLPDTSSKEETAVGEAQNMAFL